MATIFRTASIWLKAAIVCMALGLLLFVIGFATTSWMVYPRSDVSKGLWQWTDCTRRGGDCYTGSYQTLNDYHRSIQAMECLGLIGFALAFIIMLLYMVLDSCRRRDFLQATTALAFAGLAFSIIGYAIFGSTSNRKNIHGYGLDIGWSMGVACAGSAFYGMAGIALIIQLIK